MTFTNTNWDEHWKEVEALNGNTLMIVGEREVLRDGVDDFTTLLKVASNTILSLVVYMQG